MRVFLILTGMILSLVLTGCKSSQITSIWKAGQAPVPIHRIMVIGLMRDSDRSLRQQMENQMADKLCDLGYDALCSLDLYGPGIFEQMSEKEVLAKMQGDSIDAVLTIVMLNKEKEKRYVPPLLLYSPYANYYSSFYPYHLAIYNRIYQEGYYLTDTSYFWESNLYILKDQTLIYSVQTQSLDPVTIKRMAHEYGTLIVGSMVDQHIIATKH